MFLDINHEIVPVLNKIDLPASDIDKTKKQIEDVIGIDTAEAVPCSGKTGDGIEEILEQIKFYEGVLIKTDTTYQLNYPIKYENSLSFRIKILGCINKNFIIKNLLPISNVHPLNFLCSPF